MSNNKYSILITGINGFIGQSFLKSCSIGDYNIYGLDINKNIDYSNLKGFYTIDISREFKIDMEFDYVFHFAALNQTHVGKKDYDSYYQINVIGTKNVINSLNFKNFVLMSTAKVYKQSRGKIYESSPLEPIAEYERSKLEAEKICKENIGDRKLVILRPVNIVGPGQANKAILPVFFNNFMNNKPIDVFAPPETILQFLYIDDVIRAFKLVMERNGIEGIFNLSSVDNIRLDILVENIAAITNFKSPVNFSNNTESFFSEIVSDRAESVLNWKAEIGIKEILRRYYNTFGE